MPERVPAAYRSEYIADSVVSVYLANEAAKVSFYPILDNISLLFQRALDINIALAAGDTSSIVFSNSLALAPLEEAKRIFSSPGRRDECVRISHPDGHAQVLVLVRFIEKAGGPTVYECKTLPGVDRERLEDLFERLREEQGVDVYSVFAAGRHHQQFPSQVLGPVSPPSEALISRGELGELLDKLSLELDNLYQSQSMTRGQRHDELDKVLSNIFCVVRYVAEGTVLRRRHFPYSVQLLLSSDQAKAIDECREYSSQSRPFQLSPARLLQQPLGEGSRSIADAIFESGIVEFPVETFGEGRDSSLDPDAEDTVDNVRRKLEGAFLAGFGRRLMHVPVHVGGVPWAVFFLVLQGADDERAWLENYRFYRACIPLLADGLRRIVRRHFLDQVAHVVEAEATRFLGSEIDLSEAVAAMNLKVQGLCGFFPYGPLVFSAKPVGNSLRFSLERGGEQVLLYVSVEPVNPFPAFQGGVAHDRLDSNLQEIETHVAEGIGRAKAGIALVASARAAFASALAHDVKNATSEIITRQDAALNVFRRREIGPRFTAARDGLVRANVRAMMLNSIALSINALFANAQPLADREARVFARSAIEDFWKAVLRLLLEIRAIPPAGATRHGIESKHFRLVIAPTLEAVAAFHDKCQSADSYPAYPDDWEVGQIPDLNSILRTAVRAIQLTDNLKEALSDNRMGIALSMLTEIVSNIRIDTPTEDASGRDIVIGFEIDWDGEYPVLYLQQLHRESPSTGWKPRTTVPGGIGRTLSLFGEAPGALGLMTVEIASGLYCLNAARPSTSRNAIVCTYCLSIRLKLLRASREEANE